MRNYVSYTYLEDGIYEVSIGDFSRNSTIKFRIHRDALSNKPFEVFYMGTTIIWSIPDIYVWIELDTLEPPHIDEIDDALCRVFQRLAHKIIKVMITDREGFILSEGEEGILHSIPPCIEKRGWLNEITQLPF